MNTHTTVDLTNCYGAKDVIAKAGAAWNPTAKCWTATREQFEAIDATIADWRGRGASAGKDKRTAVAAWDKTSGRWYTPAPVAPVDPRIAELSAFAADVRRTGLTHGRDADVAACVRLGLLSTSAAMNADD